LVTQNPDGTGTPALLIANSTDATLTALTGNSNGTFTPVPGSPFPSGAASLSAVVLEDLTNDGRLDLLFLDRTDNQLFVKLNQATTVATISLPNVSVTGTGTDTVVAAYAGDTLYPSVTSNSVDLATVAPPLTGDFSIASATAPQTVLPGVAATYTIAITPLNGFNSAVTLTATGLPAGATAVFTPASVTPTGTVAVSSTLVIQTAGSSSGSATGGAAAAALQPAGNSTAWPLGLALAAFPLAGIVVLRGRRRVGSRLSGWIFAAIVSIGLLGLGSCGTGSGFFGAQPTTYTITVTATSGALQHSTTVTLTVQ